MQYVTVFTATPPQQQVKRSWLYCYCMLHRRWKRLTNRDKEGSPKAQPRDSQSACKRRLPRFGHVNRKEKAIDSPGPLWACPSGAAAKRVENDMAMQGYAACCSSECPLTWNTADLMSQGALNELAARLPVTQPGFRKTSTFHLSWYHCIHLKGFLLFI